MSAPPGAGPATAGEVIGFHGVSKRYRGALALDDVTFTLTRGAVLGLVGESGSGKSTCVRLALGLDRPTSGALTFAGQPYPRGRRALRPLRRQLGFVQQDPYDSLDPRMTLRQIIGEPARIHRAAAGGRFSDERVARLLAAVGLPDAPLDSYPARYSGGGRQRIAIARALALDPGVLLCDEPTSSLDVSVQAQIVNLLLEAKGGRGLSVLFVSHDLDLIGRVADQLAVLYAGRVVETGPAALVRAQPRHPYTKALHDAVPADHPARRRAAAGPAPDLIPGPLPGLGPEPAAGAVAGGATVAGAAGHVAGAASRGVAGPAASLAGRDCCVFATRCPRAQPRCREQRPPVTAGLDGRTYACFYPLDLPPDAGLVAAERENASRENAEQGRLR